MTVALHVIYSPELEVERVENTLKRASWYREHGYAEKLGLPNGIDLEGEFTHEQIETIVRAEYEEGFYSSFKNQIDEGFAVIADNPAFSESPLGFEKSYTIKLTKYGTGGSYHVPNMIVINIVKMKADIAAVLHEMIHLCIEADIKKHNVSQQCKERLVDLLLKELFPDYAYEQSRFANNPRVDVGFATYYPDVSKVIENCK